MTEAYECGPQKTALEIAEKIADWLPGVIKKHNIRKVCDLGCGDLYWLSMMDLDIDYTGYDEVVRKSALNRAIDRRWKVFHADIFKVDFPESDMVIVKDVFIHYSDVKVMELIEKIKKKAKFLLSESHDTHEWPRPTKHQKTEDGKRYPCAASATDLRQVIGEPIEDINILPGKHMMLWRL